MNGTQCDTCRVFAPFHLPPGWLVLLEQESASVPSVLAALTGGRGGGADLTGTFCSLRCLAEYAYARLAAEGAEGTDSGIAGPEGWVG